MLYITLTKTNLNFLQQVAKRHCSDFCCNFSVVNCFSKYYWQHVAKNLLLNFRFLTAVFIFVNVV